VKRIPIKGPLRKIDQMEENPTKGKE